MTAPVAPADTVHRATPTLERARAEHRTAHERIAEIECRFGSPLLWRLALAAPPIQLKPMRTKGQPTKRADERWKKGYAR